MTELLKIRTKPSKTSWTQDQVKLAFGMKFLGKKREEIKERVGHSENSITYLFGKRFKAEADRDAFTGLIGEEAYKAFATTLLDTTETSDSEQ